MKTEQVLDIGLPALAVLEAIITAKASKGNYVGQTGMDLIKARDESKRYTDQQREKALERAAQESERKSDRDFREKSFKLQEGESKRRAGIEDAEFLAKEDAVHRALVKDDKLRALAKGEEQGFDAKTNTVTMGKKGLLPDLSPEDKFKLEANPEKFAFEKNPLADFMAKWDYQVTNPKPTAPRSATAPKPPNPKLLPAGTVEDLGGIQEAVTMLDKLGDAAGKMKTDLGPFNKIRTLNPYDTDIQNLQQYIATTKQVIGKGLEGGVLRREDEFKYEKIIPKVSDTPEVRAQKKVQLRDMLVNKYKTQVRAQGDAGYSTGNLPTEIATPAVPTGSAETYTPAVEALRVKAMNGDKEAARYLDSKGIEY